ncbi:hypothetical protein JRO89_XS02G0055800 [Xanthoceras sorbifolium]|uniref:Cytochrome P450 n=1 Tax=Xanthoceras sorbifolium TaxID=99658 RepID=A0ABQ8IEV3_9ROSI|nr:hypothetical protein JRO89_XS02G0055800 [Xanthoceras sorbifolium]
MEFSLHLEEIIVFFAFLLAIIFLGVTINKTRRNNRKGRRKPPEAAGAWPIIGHLHLLGSNQLLHQKLGEMADKYGKAFTIRLGIHRALVISSWEVTRECFTINDKVLSTRPESLGAKILAYDHLMFGFAPYGPYWRDVRKLATVELLSNHSLELLQHVRDTEISIFIKELYAQCVKNGGAAAVEIKERFSHLSANIIVRMIAGKQYFGTDVDEESRRFQKALGNFFYLMGLYFISDTVTFLGWLDVVKGYINKMKRTARQLDYVLKNWVEEHSQRRLNRNVSDEEQDFIHVMLSAMDNHKISAQDANITVKATCLNLILGGGDTTPGTLTWALALLLNNRHVLKKAQDELNLLVGKHRQVDESDIKDLIYLQAIVKETLRLYPAAPLSGPRKAMEDCTIAGYHIPAGTLLVANLWKLHRDPRIWLNPSEFVPERFLNEHANLDVRGLQFEFLPFGSGRRKCPGISLALQVLHLTLARLLHAFELGTVEDTAVDMSEGPGLTVPKATPLEVILTPRLPSMLFE